jgi:hypothetical protein
MAATTNPQNPQILICDTDALIQIFVARQGELLKRLKRRYGIQPVVPEAVEAEITRRSLRNSPLFVPGFNKALDNGALLLIEERIIGAFTSNDPHSTYNSIQLMGQNNAIHIGPGEAHVFAAGVVLRAPVLSNDAKAVLIADRYEIKRPPQIIRAYDIFMLFHQNGELDQRDCDKIRQSLLKAGEALPFQVRNKNYSDGLPHIFPRLVDEEYPQLAKGIQAELADLEQLVIRTNQPQQPPSTPDTTTSSTDKDDPPQL